MSIVLVSKDGKRIEVEKEVALRSYTLKNILEDCDEDEAVPVPNVEGGCLAKVVKYCEFHEMAAKGNMPDDEIREWDESFGEVDDEELFDLILAANFLDVGPLLDLMCKKVAEIIKGCKTPLEIQERFKIPRGLKLDEEGVF